LTFIGLNPNASMGEARGSRQMNKLQIIFAGVTVMAGLGAALMFNGPAVPPPLQAIAPSAPSVDEVLVATRDLSYGTMLNDQDMSWQEWPKGAVPKGVVRKSELPTAKDDIKGSLVRLPFSNGEPFRRERLVKGATAGLMSTLLAQGRRAVAIDVSVNTTAGGFILPNDRVDVIRTFRDADQSKDRGAEVVGAQVILANVRVLAMGQTVETKNGESVVTGATATLELDPKQAELVILAQRTGQLTLTLRAMIDAHLNEGASTPDQADQPDANGSMTIVRFGVSSSYRGK
jgi:pilus assembly protein CpaB